MGATIHGADVVGKAQDAVGVGIHAPLQGRFNLNAFFLGVHIDDIGMKRILFRIHVLDVFLDPAFVEVDLFVGLTIGPAGAGPVIPEDDFDPTIEVGKLPQARGEGLEIEGNTGRENLNIRLKANGRPRAALLSRGRFQNANRRPALKPLGVDLVLAMHRDLHPLTEGVDHGHTNPVQATGNLVATGAKLATGVEHGEHRFQGALAGAGVNIGGNAPAVVGDRAGAIVVEHDQDLVAVARQRFVNGVVDHLVHQVVQTPGTGGADVHPRALANGLQPFENLDLLGAVGGLNLARRLGFGTHAGRNPQRISTGGFITGELGTGG